MELFDKEFGFPNWLAHRHRVLQTKTGKAADGCATEEDGKTVILSGAVWPANDATAEGIVVNKVDVSKKAKPISVMVEGYVYEGRLPVEVSEEAKAAMKEIKFTEYNTEEK